MIFNKNSVNLLLTYNKYFCLNRSIVSALNQKESKLSSNQDTEWENALPFKSIPGPSKFQLFKNFSPFGKYYKKPRLESTKLLHKEFGDLIRIPAMGGNPEIILLFADEYFEKIYRSEGKWPQRFTLPSMKYYRTVKNPETFAVGDLMTGQGESWGKFRSIVNPIMMQPKGIKIYVPRLEKISRQFIERIRKIRDDKTKEVPGTFDKEINKWALESVCNVALDKQLGLFEDVNKNPDAFKIINAMDEILKSTVDIGFNPIFFKYFETPKFKKLMNAYEILTSISKKYIAEAMEIYKINEIDLKQKNDIDKSVLERLISINKDVAIVMALEMLFAGVDTTTSAITGCLLTLAKNPLKQEKLRSELRNILPETDSIITEEKLKNLPYLRAVIKESLRIYPVVGENSRKSGDNIVIKNYQIPKGIDITMINSIFYNNENYFSKSDEFIPERWLRNKNDIEMENSLGCPIATKPSNPFVYLPFGHGTRMCIGKRIVDMELEITLANIIRNFHVEFNYPADDIFATYLINIPEKELKFKFVDIQ